MTTAKDVGSIILLVLSRRWRSSRSARRFVCDTVYIIGVIVAFARHDELASWNARIKVALAWPLEFWLKLKTMKAFAFLGRQVGRLSSRLKKWNAGRIRRTEKRLGK